jgi:NOL1/NOP2/fmu family ribosome biogenesis protein
LLPDLAGALRVWPHANDTGGFFVAVLEKLSEDPVAAELHSPEPAPEGLYRGPVVDRFGLPEEALEGWVVFRANARRLHLAPADLAVPAPLRPEAVGLPFLHTRMSRPQLTSAAARLLGPWATQNVVELTPEQAAAYEHRIALSLEVDQRAAVTGDGLVLVCHQGITLGLGLARAGRLSSLVPKRLVPGR